MSSGTKTGLPGGTGPATDADGHGSPADVAGKDAGVAGKDAGVAGDAREGDVHEGDARDGGVHAAGPRERIDELDRRIIALVQERRAVSAVGRRTRSGADGEPAEAAAQSGGSGGLAREMEILKRYRRELGRPGTQLAMTLLSLSRS